MILTIFERAKTAISHKQGSELCWKQFWYKIKCLGLHHKLRVTSRRFRSSKMIWLVMMWSKNLRHTVQPCLLGTIREVSVCSPTTLRAWSLWLWIQICTSLDFCYWTTWRWMRRRLLTSSQNLKIGAKDSNSNFYNLKLSLILIRKKKGLINLLRSVRTTMFWTSMFHSL